MDFLRRYQQLIKLLKTKYKGDNSSQPGSASLTNMNEAPTCFGRDEHQAQVLKQKAQKDNRLGCMESLCKHQKTKLKECIWTIMKLDFIRRSRTIFGFRLGWQVLESVEVLHDSRQAEINTMNNRGLSRWQQVPSKWQFASNHAQWKSQHGDLSAG